MLFEFGVFEIFQKYSRRPTIPFIRPRFFQLFRVGLHTQSTLSRVTNAVFCPPQVHPSANLVNRVYTDFKVSYTDPTVLKWSFWHVLCLSTYIQVDYVITSPRRSFAFFFFFFCLRYSSPPTQVFLYVNILYTYIADMTNTKVLLNGAVDFLATISGESVRFRWFREQKP